jgi:putative nucleotidyltransferase with HDIG domain
MTPAEKKLSGLGFLPKEEVKGSLMSKLEKIREFVKTECQKPTNIYGFEAFTFHIEPVAQYAKRLAKELGGDSEVIEAAAWLHDIGSIVSNRKDHHITGSEIAKPLLKELGFSADKIELIISCIKHHRGSMECDRKSLEEKIVTEADVMANFDDVAGIFKVAMVLEGMDRAEAKVEVLRKLEAKYNQLHFAKSKEILKPKYEAAKLLLS